MKNEKTAKRGINFIDIVILLLIIAAAAGAIMLFSKDKAKPVGTSGVPVTYELQMTNLGEELAYAAKVGDEITENRTKSVIGTILEVNVEPMTETTFNSLDGTMKQVTYPGKYRVTLVCEGTAQKKDGKLIVSGITMGVGTVVDFKTKNFAGDSYCVSIHVSETKEG